MATASIDVINAKGTKVATLDLPAEVFDVKTNVPLIHQVVVAQQAAARQGTHSTKRRGEVSGEVLGRGVAVAARGPGCRPQALQAQGNR